MQFMSPLRLIVGTHLQFFDTWPSISLHVGKKSGVKSSLVTWFPEQLWIWVLLSGLPPGKGLLEQHLTHITLVLCVHCRGLETWWSWPGFPNISILFRRLWVALASRHGRWHIHAVVRCAFFWKKHIRWPDTSVLVWPAYVSWPCNWVLIAQVWMICIWTKLTDIRSPTPRLRHCWVSLWHSWRHSCAQFSHRLSVWSPRYSFLRVGWRYAKALLIFQLHASYITSINVLVHLPIACSPVTLSSSGGDIMLVAVKVEVVTILMSLYFYTWLYLTIVDNCCNLRYLLVTFTCRSIRRSKSSHLRMYTFQHHWAWSCTNIYYVYNILLSFMILI